MLSNIIVTAYFNYSGYFFKFFPRILSFFLPRTLVVEASNTCMLRCPACSTVNSSKRQNGAMAFSTFKHLVDSIHWNVKRINFSYAGEPLVNQELDRMIAYAASRNISTIVETNGMLLYQMADALIDSRLSKLNIALDGINQEMAEKYRKGVNFNNVVSGIRKIVGEKKSRNSNLPEIHLQCVVMKHNEDCIPQLLKLAKELGVDYVDIKSMILSGGIGLNRQDMQEIAQEYLPSDSKFLRYTKNRDGWVLKKLAHRFCSHLLSDAVIMWNGDVTICTMDVEGSMVVGNMLKRPLSEIWKSEAYCLIRKKSLNGKLPFCFECGYLMSDFKTFALH